MRIFTAAMIHESNSFSPIPTGIESFREGSFFEPLATSRNQNLRAAESVPFVGEFVGLFSPDHEVSPGPIYLAQPSAPVSEAAYHHMRGRILAALRGAGEVDAVALFLHGAQMAFGCDDCEGDLLREIRKIVGPDVPVVALLDLHGNITDAMLENAILIACKEYPHTDYWDRGKELKDILERTAVGEINPVMSRTYIPVVGSFHTTREPMRGLVDEVMEMETGDVLSISFMHGFCWSDFNDVGANALVVTDSNKQKGDALSLELAQRFFEVCKVDRGSYLVSMNEAIDQSLASKGGLTVIADTTDNAGGGAPSDSTYLLKALLDRGVENAALGMLWDPVAVQLARNAGVGAHISLRIGGKTGPVSGEPLDLEVEVLALRDNGSNEFVAAADYRAAVRVEGVDIVLNSNRSQVFGPGPFEQMGIDVSAKSIVVVKSAQHFHAGFAPIANKIIYCDPPGCMNLDISQFNYQRMNRKLWPVDDISEIFPPRRV